MTKQVDRQWQVVARYDYMPFGEEVPASQPDKPYKRLFTGKARDTETGLDYFEARYLRSASGRFSTVDPVTTVQANLIDPERWNRYAYGRNNPLRWIDPSGKTVYVVTYSYGNESGDREFFLAASTRARDIERSKGFDSKKDKVLLLGVNSVEALETAIKRAAALGEKFGKIGEVALFSHAGPEDGPLFRSGGSRSYTNEQDKYRLLSLAITWESPSSIAGFYGCNTAEFAQMFADAQRVSTYGFDDGTTFSSRPDTKNYGYVGGRASELYMLTQRGHLPPIRLDPTTRR